MTLRVKINLMVFVVVAIGAVVGVVGFMGQRLAESTLREIQETERARLATIESPAAADRELYERIASELARGEMYNTINLGMIIFAVVVSQIIGWFVGENIARPMREITDAARKMERGEIDFNIKHRSRDELGSLAEAFRHMIESHQRMVAAAEEVAAGNLHTEVRPASERDSLGKSLRLMVESLRELIIEARETSEKVSTGADQINGASQTLSAGATEQAASLEEISSSVNEIAAKTKGAAANASQVNHLANTARNDADKGGRDVESMVAAMDEIGASSQKISNIIKAIDDIAFQTNILALNAAVEAARAGRHGKGFAVVANEVRTLAGRSAKAAAETEELIKLAKDKIERGQQVATQTQESFQRIIQGIAKVADLAGEISASADEQARGVAEINTGLSQAATVTHQNSEHTEQMAAAAMDLAGQAERLAAILGKFRVDDAGTAAADYAPAAKSARRGAATALPAPGASGGNWGNPRQSLAAAPPASESGEFISWSDSLSVGVPSIDAEHQGLVNLVNRTYTALKSGKSKNALGGILRELLEYTEKHFAREERLMGNFSYPELDVHRQAHRELMGKTKEIARKFESGEGGLGIETMNFLKDWLVNHIGKVDMRYVDFLVDHGVS